MRLVSLSVALALLTACSVGPQYQIQTLPNGKQVKLIAVTRMASTNGNKWMVLKYQTDLPISDVNAISREIDQIWVYFKNDVERAGMKDAVIKASSAPTGTIVQESKAYNVAYKKGQDGTWSRVED